MTIEILARSIAPLGTHTQDLGGKIAFVVTDLPALYVLDLSVAGGAWREGAADDADCVLVATSTALRGFADPALLERAIEAGELAVLGAADKLQALARMVDEGPGWIGGQAAAA